MRKKIFCINTVENGKSFASLLNNNNNNNELESTNISQSNCGYLQHSSALPPPLSEPPCAVAFGTSVHSR